MKLCFRLEGIRVNDHQLEELAPHDELGLLHEPEPPASLEEAAADDPLGLLDGPDINIYEGRHVPTEPVTQPDKIAQRKPCVDFERFEPVFKQCHAELQAGIRKLVTFRNEQAPFPHFSTSISPPTLRLFRRFAVRAPRARS